MLIKKEIERPEEWITITARRETGGKHSQLIFELSGDEMANPQKALSALKEAINYIKNKPK